jgi:nucleotide-binding universal stress UspA family protein
MKKLEETEVEVQKVEASGSVRASSPAVSTDSKPTINNGSVGELPKRIIVPLDGSDFSFRAAQYAINIARLTGGEILCIHAIADLPYIEYMAPAGGLTVPRYIQEAKKQTDEWFSQVKSRAAKEGVKITAETIFSPPSVAESIINYASEQKADLIVIGTRGRSGLKRLVLGSVASAVVAHASCPVLVVR